MFKPLYFIFKILYSPYRFEPKSINKINLLILLNIRTTYQSTDSGTVSHLVVDQVVESNYASDHGRKINNQHHIICFYCILRA